MRAAFSSRRPLAPLRGRAWLPHRLALVVLAVAGIAAGADELGHPARRSFPPGRAKIGYLTPAVTQDGDGFIYIASTQLLRVFDGTAWREIGVPPEATVARKFARTADGVVYAAGAGLIGFVRGAGDAAVFVSLADRLPTALRESVDLHDVLAAGTSVYFAGEEHILRWREGRFTVIPCPTPPRTRGARLHRVGDTVYAAVPGRGLCRIVDDRLEEISADPEWRDHAILLLEPGPDGTLTALTATRGFFQLTAGRAAPLPAEANRWLAGKTIWRALRLRDGSLAVIFSAVSGDGGMRFDAAGRYAGVIDETLGFYLRELRDLFQDREGGLWLGSDVGLFRLEWPSPLTVFDNNNGLGAGAVADVVRHAGVLYAATSEGLFRLHPAKPDGRAARFERVLAEPVTSLHSHPAGLLALGYTTVWAQTATGFTEIAAHPADRAGLLVSMARDPDRVWIKTTGGVSGVRYTPQGWQAEGAGLPPAEARPPEPVAGVLAECAAAGGGRWVARAEAVTLHAPDGRELRRLPHLALVSAGEIATLREETGPAGLVLWIGGGRGLVRFDLAQKSPPPAPYTALLTAAGVRAGERLPPEHAPLRFNYVALRHQIIDGVTYQTRLVGLENAWSDWTAERVRAFVRLPSGAYRFEVRARDADGVISVPGALAFTVLAPWWFTPLAWMGYVLVGFSLVTAFVRIRTRSLHRRAARLEAVVAERTDELAKKNTELVRLNQLELDEKISARLGEEKARLEVLRYQLNPHFLFNTLASISAALPAGASTPRTMVERLAEFCRLTLHRPNDRDWTTVGEEVQLLRSYLEIEQSRWGALLDVTIDCDPAMAGEQLPHFLLLPLVENALKYGRATSADRVGLKLKAERGAGGALVFTVANTGEWVEASSKKTVSTLGIGLENLRERLARHYPRTHHLEFSHAEGWVTAVLRISASPKSS